MNFFQKIEVIWRSVSVVQRALLLAIMLTFVIVAGLLVYWARRPDMGVLYSGLDAEEASKIAEKISEKDIIYKLGNGGTTIYVPKENAAQLRLDMAKEGLLGSGQKGYSIFDDEKIGISPFVQNINLTRAIQDELAKSIQMIDGVVHARILIVKPESSLFTSTTAQTSASVFLRLRPGYGLSGLNIAAITHLVASGVEGLKSENITVVDSQGRLLTSKSNDVMNGGAGTVADYRERVEQSLAKKAEDMLTTVLGPGRATVRVSAVIDMTSTNTVKKSYEGKGVTVTEEIKEKSKAGGGSKEGKSTGKETDNTINTKKLFDETMETIVVLPGDINSLTVAAFVDLSPILAPDANEAVIAAATDIMKVEDVEEIIKKAIGHKIEEDGLKVVKVKFNRPTGPLLDGEQGGGLDFVAVAGQASLGIMAVCALLVLKMLSGAKKKSLATASLPAGGAETAGLLPGEAEGGSDSSTMRVQIANRMQSDPEQARQLFSSWLEEKD